MKKNILKHITVVGFTSNIDLSTCEILEKELNEAKGRFKLAKKDVKDARQKLNQAYEVAISNMENKKKEKEETQNNLVNEPDSSSSLNIENIK